MKNQEYIDNLLSRVSAVSGAPAVLGYVYVNDDYMLQFLAHDVLPDPQPGCATLETYLVTLCFDDPSCVRCRPYDYQIGYGPAFAI